LTVPHNLGAVFVSLLEHTSHFCKGEIIVVNKSKIILHIDMNSFYASVEQVHDPTLKGKAIAIAGNPKERRGIIITCSYEARAKGVYTTQRVSEALKLCPELIVLPPNFERYRQASKGMFAILRRYTDLVEPVSIDEGYIDVTELAQQRSAVDLAQEIQERILMELGLPCSIGIAPNMFLAKTASDMKKPMGITILRKRDVQTQLWHLPVVEMHGIGESTARKLGEHGILTIGDLAMIEESVIRNTFGKNGVRLRERANGIDRREVDPDAIYDTKSVGNSTTLPFDETDLRVLSHTIDKLCEKVAERLEVKQLAGSTVIMQVREYDWHNHTRSKTVANSIYLKEDIYHIAWDLFESHWDGTPIRLLGVTVSNVIDRKESTQQLSIFNFEEHVKEEPILELMHEMERKFGKGVVQRGVHVSKKTSYASRTSFSKDFLDDHK